MVLLFLDIGATFNAFIESAVRSFVQMLKNFILNNVDSIALSFYSNLGDITANLTKTPEGFNSGVLGLIHTISDTAILPIGVMILTFVSCYEIIQMLIQKNNGHDVGPQDIFMVLFKMTVGVILLNNCFEITMSFFDVASSVTTTVGGIVGDLSGVSNPSWNTFKMSVAGLSETGDSIILLIALVLITFLLRFAMFFISMYCLIIVYSRFIEIYIYCSASPLTFSTLINKEWGQIGISYIKNIMALAFQAFFMMVIVGMYTGLITGFTMTVDGNDLYYMLLGILGSTIILVMSLAKTKDISKSIFNAH